MQNSVERLLKRKFLDVPSSWKLTFCFQHPVLEVSIFGDRGILREFLDNYSDSLILTVSRTEVEVISITCGEWKIPSFEVQKMVAAQQRYNRFLLEFSSSKERSLKDSLG